VTAEPELPPGGEIVEADPPWEAWSPREAADLLGGLSVPWAVAAGWAVDLFRGGTARAHEDLEIAVPSGRFPEVLAALAGYDLEVIGSGRRWPLDSPAFAVMTQTWVREPGQGPYRMDIFREPHDGGTWICRRDPAIRRPYREVITATPDGIPYLVPEIALLFKAKHTRPKDEADFEGALPLLTPASRAWLSAALTRVHPGHPWLARLARLA
jgi:hypothetical protein